MRLTVSIAVAVVVVNHYSHLYSTRDIHTLLDACVCVWSDIVRHCSNLTSEDGDVTSKTSQETPLFLNIRRLNAGDTFVSINTYVTRLVCNRCFMCIVNVE